MSKKTKNILLSIPKVLLLCAIGITIFLPLLWMFFSAFKPPKDIISYPPTFVPAEFTLENFERLASRVKILGVCQKLYSICPSYYSPICISLLIGRIRLC